MQIPLFFPKQVTPLFKHIIHLFLLFFFLQYHIYEALDC